MVTVAWRGDTGAVAGSCIGVRVVTVIGAIIQVRITMVGMRAPPGMGIRVVAVMGAECKLTGGEKWGHLLHVSCTASIPVANVAVEACTTATCSVTAVRIPSQKVAHVRDEGYLQYKTRARCEGQGLSLVIDEGVADSMENGCICGSLHPRC